MLVVHWEDAKVSQHHAFHIRGSWVINAPSIDCVSYIIGGKLGTNGKPLLSVNTGSWGFDIIRKVNFEESVFDSSRKLFDYSTRNDIHLASVAFRILHSSSCL